MTTTVQSPARFAYLHRHPRGFANECELVKCATPAEIAEAEANGYERLTRASAIAEIRYVNAENDAWGSNRAFGRARFEEIPAWSELDGWETGPRLVEFETRTIVFLEN